LPPPSAAGYDAWLRYDAADERAIKQSYDRLPAVVVALDETPVIKAAREELWRGVRGMLDRRLRIESRLPDEDAILLGSLASLRKIFPALSPSVTLTADGFWLKTVKRGGHAYLLVTGVNDRGVLYGAFALLRRMALGAAIDALDVQEDPYAGVRM